MEDKRERKKIFGFLKTVMLVHNFSYKAVICFENGECSCKNHWAKREKSGWPVDCMGVRACVYGIGEKSKVSRKADRKRCVLKGDMRDMNLDTHSSPSSQREGEIDSR